jgi:signal transduction histidine kinase
VLGEVRDTLSDLRAEVSDQRGLAETLEAHLERVATRSDVEVDFRNQSTARLPLVQERELWRIAQEAITNVERHARASHLRVRWTCDGRAARLTVADDGRGFGIDAPRRPDSFGITGMQERADAIGARLEIESEPYVGTLLECHLEVPDPATVPAIAPITAPATSAATGTAPAASPVDVGSRTAPARAAVPQGALR